MSDEAQGLIDALAQRNEDAARLAMLASIAVQVEPELLRALRLQMPNADPGAEADVWLSDLVESQSALAMTLRPDVRELLQEKLRQDRDAFTAASETLLRVHGDIPEVTRVEEQVTIESLIGGDAAKDRINTLLAPIVAAMENAPHKGLARWAVRAFDAVPQTARETEAVWRMMRASSVTRAVAAPESTTEPVESLLSDLPRRKVTLRLLPDRLEIEAARDGRPVVMVSDEFFEGQFIDALLGRIGFDVVSSEAINIAADEEIERVDALVVVGNEHGIDYAIGSKEYLRAEQRGLPIAVFVRAASGSPTDGTFSSPS